MNLMPKKLEARFAQVGSQSENPDPIVVAKYFDPCSFARWFATEYNPEDKMLFGYVSLYGDHNDEWGYFSLRELARYQGAIGVGIERDLYCGEFPISKILKCVPSEPELL